MAWMRVPSRAFSFPSQNLFVHKEERQHSPANKPLRQSTHTVLSRCVWVGVCGGDYKDGRNKESKIPVGEDFFF